ncbi:MAG: hypothetical protein Q4A00_05715 [Flavobacteriaceae bacterium]|nr:hypothetical protein [Flavobacteriaceae bacterium]
MIKQEFFPPSEQELEEMIYTLTKQLEDEAYRDQWQELSEQREELERQLEQIKNEE